MTDGQWTQCWHTRETAIALADSLARDKYPLPEELRRLSGLLLDVHRLSYAVPLRDLQDAMHDDAAMPELAAAQDAVIDELRALGR